MSTDLFQTLKGSLQTMCWTLIAVSISFKPSKDRYKPVSYCLEDIFPSMFQTLKGSLQTDCKNYWYRILKRFQTLKGSLQTQSLSLNSECTHSFKPSKDRYKHRSPPLNPLILSNGFQTLKGSLQTFHVSPPPLHIYVVSNPQRIATNIYLLLSCSSYGNLREVIRESRY